MRNSARKPPLPKLISWTKIVGADALNIGLNKSGGRYLHISENDIEYFDGWDKMAVDLFEAFPKLGQLSPFGSISEDDSVLDNHPALLRHSQGRILYEAKRNVTTTCFLRRELFDKGLRVHNPTNTTDVLYPNDGLLSKHVKKMGYMVAWSPHFPVKDHGHTITEYEGRREYYHKTFDQKEMSIEGLEKRIEDWDRIPKPSRKTFLFSDAIISPEKTEASGECPLPRIWFMIDLKTPEIETLEFVYSLARLIKPDWALETEAWEGDTLQ